MTADSLIKVSPVLFCAPYFWTNDFWTETARQWAWVDQNFPVEKKPSCNLAITLDVTLGEVIEEAARIWELEPGADILRRSSNALDVFDRYAFVDEHEILTGDLKSRNVLFAKKLAVIDEEGNEALVRGSDITYGQLLVASLVGLIDGDVCRPYVHPVRAQGLGGNAIELARAAADLAQLAWSFIHSHLASTGHAIHDLDVAAGELNEHVKSPIEEGAGGLYIWNELKDLWKKEG